MNVIDFDNGACKRIRGYIDSYLNSELLVETNHEVLRHVETCKDCAREMEDRLRLKRLLQRAVQRELAPPHLHDRIRRDIRGERPTAWSRWMLAAAALVLLAGAWGLLRLQLSNESGAPTSLAALSGDGARLMKIGLGDHIHCAVESSLANKQFTFEQMSEEMGPEFIGLVPLVKERVPDNYQITIGHRCHVEGREFVHLILKGGEGAVISVIVTKKNNESFDAEGAAAALDRSKGPLYESNLDSYEVAGFETGDYLAFVISNVTRNENLELASKLTPSMRDFLTRLSARA